VLDMGGLRWVDHDIIKSADITECRGGMAISFRGRDDVKEGLGRAKMHGALEPKRALLAEAPGQPPDGRRKGEGASALSCTSGSILQLHRRRIRGVERHLAEMRSDVQTNRFSRLDISTRTVLGP